ncbi:MAG: DUF2723 domain-containing protein [bacterium]|nr:DUF2723 domain-containing protein [bacterium]
MRPTEGNADTERTREREIGHVARYAAATAGLVALVWFLSRLSHGIGSGPWQALSLVENPPFKGPLLSSAMGRLVCSVWPAKALLSLNLLAAVTGAVACAVVGHIVARVSERHLARSTALMSGILAGVLLAFTPAVTYASTGAHPAMLTVALALGGVAALVSASEGNRPGMWYALSGILTGLAAANHPSFVLLAVILMATSVLMTPERNPATGMALVATGFIAGAVLPLVFAVGSGESVRQFLGHALPSSGAVWGDAVQERFYGDRLGSQFWLVAKALVVFSPIVLLRRELRPVGTVFAAVLVCFGPLLPVLTRELPWGTGLPEPAAPLVFGMAACVAASVCGLAVTLEAAQQAVGLRAQVVVVGLLAIGGAAMAGQIGLCPNRQHGLAAALPETVLSECPENAVLVSGDRTLTSMLLVAQHGSLPAARLRPDVVVVPVEAVRSPRVGIGARLLAERGVRLNPGFPSDEAVRRWEREQPVALSKALEERDEERAWHDLAVWEFIRTNASSRDSARALCFAGVDSPWLAARGHSTGGVTSYPRRDAAEPAQSFHELAQTAADANCAVLDPDLAACLARMLVVESARARLQAEPENAGHLGELAARLAPGGPLPLAAVMRAAARSGDREGVTQLTEAYALAAARTSGFTPEAAESLAQAAARDLQRHALAEEFALRLVGDHVGEEDESSRSRAAIAARLWVLDELTVLAEGYGYVVAGGDDSNDVRYEWAAALVQLGDLRGAREALKPMVERAPEEMAARLKEDGRFALLLLTADGGGTGKGESMARL